MVRCSFGSSFRALKAHFPLARKACETYVVACASIVSEDTNRRCLGSLVFGRPGTEKERGGYVPSTLGDSVRGRLGKKRPKAAELEG